VFLFPQPEHITKGYVPRLANARLPGSYINHYCANGGVVVPAFGYPTDQQAIDVLQKAYGPGYKVVGVPGGTREVLLNAGETGCTDMWSECDISPVVAP
jgi:agmatine deiminase